MKSWNHAVITYKGLALQAKLMAGHSLAITKVEIGSGYVDPETLRDQVAVAEVQKTLTQVASLTYPEDGKCAIRIKITNEGVTSQWTARQIGFYAMDPDEGEILYFLAQSDDESGTLVPSDTEMYDYSAEWTFYFKYGQADNVTVVVDPSNTISWDEMESYVQNALKDFKPGDFIPMDEKAAPYGVASLDGAGNLVEDQIPDINCGVWDDESPLDILEHNTSEVTHENMVIDGNNLEVMDESTTLEEHIVSPYAHQNLILDGNQN